MVSSFTGIWLLILLLLWALFLFGGFVLGPADDYRRMPRWTRMASSATLVIAAWSWYGVSWETAVAPFALLLALGMTLGFVGDLALAGLLPGGRNVLAGMAAFGLGHIFYIAAGTAVARQHIGIRWEPLLLWLVVGAGGWYLIVFRGQAPGTLHWAALPYALLLAVTAGVATGLALQVNLFWFMAVGGALFLLSDLILATELFNDTRFFLIGDVIWLTYGTAQMLIVYTAGVAHFVLR